MKPGDACCENRPPDWPKPARSGSYREFGDERATGRTLPLNSFSVIDPVTCSFTDSISAFRLSSSGSCHRPAYTRNAHCESSCGLNWFWWIVPTSFSSSLCAVRMISAAGTSYRSRTLRPTIRPSMWSTMPAPGRHPRARLCVWVDGPRPVARPHPPGPLEQLDEAQPRAVERHGAPLLELDLQHL